MAGPDEYLDKSAATVVNACHQIVISWVDLALHDISGFVTTVLRALPIILLYLALFLGSSLAQEPSPELKSEYDKAFAAMMADLANPEPSFQFVKIAIEVGDLRGAIAALE